MPAAAFHDGRDHMRIGFIVRLIAAKAFLDALLRHDKKEKK